MAGAVPLRVSDFEADGGGLSASGNNPSWARGTPAAAPGPGGAHSGTMVWATNLAGDYNLDEDSYLSAPPLDLTAYRGQYFVISWWQWLQTVARYGFAALEVSNDSGATWATVYGAASGDVATEGWTPAGVLLGPEYAVRDFRYRFHLSSQAFTAPGWYLDDLTVSALALPPCRFLSGGLILGTLTSFYTGMFLNDGTVFSAERPQERTTSFGTGDDPATPEGFYLLFSSLTGPRPITALQKGYEDRTEMVDVPVNGMATQDFRLFPVSRQFLPVIFR
jgi:hypothetical protein